MDDTTASIMTMNSGGTDSRRGKTTPASAREGCLLLIRALCERLGKKAEPYVVGGFLAAALDECGSSSSTVRQAAEDAAVALVKIANPWAFPRLIFPLLVKALQSTEWRVKFNALERLSQCATTAPKQVCHFLPKLIPIITNQVWDTKAQVTKAAASALLAVCETNENPDISPAIPAVVNAIYKPSTTNAAVQELMGTTFVASVDASTLSILCPVLARALKEKLAINKRAACIVISNMSRLVDSPQAVAPFGPLLVPELKKVATNVQFEEIRDAALSALGNLTKALGDSYNSQEDAEQKAEEMAQEAARIEAEKQRIEDERNAEREKEEAMRQKELEERKKFKEAMDAQRELDNLAAQEAEEKRKEEAKKKDKEMRSTKAGGKCQSCGLKKCKKTCMFYSE
jgi:elongation factor 3